jgi:hypothetical protein
LASLSESVFLYFTPPSVCLDVWFAYDWIFFTSFGYVSQPAVGHMFNGESLGMRLMLFFILDSLDNSCTLEDWGAKILRVHIVQEGGISSMWINFRFRSGYAVFCSILVILWV